MGWCRYNMKVLHGVVELFLFLLHNMNSLIMVRITILLTRPLGCFYLSGRCHGKVIKSILIATISHWFLEISRFTYQLCKLISDSQVLQCNLGLCPAEIKHPKNTSSQRTSFAFLLSSRLERIVMSSWYSWPILCVLRSVWVKMVVFQKNLEGLGNENSKNVIKLSSIIYSPN